MWLETLISISEWLFLLYFLGLTAAYLMLDLIAIVHLRQYLQERVLESLPRSYTGFEPQISILVPAYNEAATIAGSIRSLLQLSYSEYEIVGVHAPCHVESGRGGAGGGLVPSSSSTMLERPLSFSWTVSSSTLITAYESVDSTTL